MVVHLAYPNKFLFMKKILLFASIGLMLVACESREEKIQNAVSQELKGVLYDFESYEPVKTQIDSAFQSPYINQEVRDLAIKMAQQVKDLTIAKVEYNSALSSMALWDSPYKTAFDRQKIKEAASKRDKTKREMDNLQEQLRSTLKDLYSKIAQQTENNNEFIGWIVKQRYKCKTGGGDPTFGDDIFVFDKDIKNCLFYSSKEEYESISRMIDQVKNIPEEDFKQKINDVNFLDAI